MCPQAYGEANARIDPICGISGLGVFAELGLNVHDRMDYDAALTVPLKIALNRIYSSKAERKLMWRAKLHPHDIIRRMVAHKRLPVPEPVR